MSIYTDAKTIPSLDDNLYDKLDAADLAFLKEQTGIEDNDSLKIHVLDVQKRAYEVYAYPCIRRFGFIRMTITRNRAVYERVLELGRAWPDAVLLDIGCCFGNDLRKVVSDGFPVQNIIGSDLRQDFWDLGHQLFRSNAETFPVAFVAGDVFDPDFLSLHEPFTKEPQSLVPDIKTLKSLNGLQGHVSAIHSASLFHLFSEDKQLQLARTLAGLVSSRPGSVIFGCHIAQPMKGFLEERLSSGSLRMFCHSPDSWRELWDGQVFAHGTVKVSAVLKNIGDKLFTGSSTADVHMLFWSVTRL